MHGVSTWVQVSFENQQYTGLFRIPLKRRVWEMELTSLSFPHGQKFSQLSSLTSLGTVVLVLGVNLYRLPAIQASTPMQDPLPAQPAQLALQFCSLLLTSLFYLDCEDSDSDSCARIFLRLGFITLACGFFSCVGASVMCLRPSCCSFFVFRCLGEPTFRGDKSFCVCVCVFVSE